MEMSSRPHCVRTPSVVLAACNRRILIKDETKQTSGAFKFRGVVHRLKSLAPGVELYAASTGNHGLAVALASSTMNMKASVFLPEDTELHKVQLIEAAGAKVTLTGHTLMEAVRAARYAATRQGAFWLSGSDDKQVVEGYRSIFSELFEDAPDLKAVAVPVGGGGLLAAALLEVPTSVQVVAVQAENSQSLTVSLAEGRQVAYPVGITIAGGLRVPEIGGLALFAALSRTPTLVTVTDVQIRQAMSLLWNDLGIRAEPSGAAALAGLLTIEKSCNTACIVSGGNIDIGHHKLLIAI